MPTNNGYRTFKEGPIHLVYVGGDHIGNVIEPTFGGADGKTQKYTAISRIWGRKTTHDSKHSAMDWLQNRHGSTMKIESATIEHSTHDILRDHEWKKAVPYGFSHHLAAHQKSTYTHRLFPGHRITASYTNDTWQHYKHAKDTTPHVGMGSASLHRHLQRVHGSHTIDAVKEHIANIKLHNPDNWQEILIESLHQPIMEDTDHFTRHGWVLDTHNPGRNGKFHDVYKHPNLPKHQIAINDAGGWTHSGKNAKIHAQGNSYEEVGKHLNNFHSKNESLENTVQGHTPRSNMLKAIKKEKVKVVKKDPAKAITMSKSQQSIGEELEDLEKNQKDPKAGPQKKQPKDVKPEDADTKIKQNPNDEIQGPKPVATIDAEGELKIKKTMTGEPGDTIAINPMMQRFPNSMGGTTAYKQIQAPEHKKQVV